MSNRVHSDVRLQKDKEFLHALATPIAVLKLSLRSLEGQRGEAGQVSGQVDPIKILKMLAAISDLERIHADFKAENFKRFQEDRDSTTEF